MEVTKEIVSAITVARLEGTLDSSTVPALHEEILPMVLERRPILLDFTKVTHVSDAGLRTMLAIYRQAQAVDGRVALVGVTGELRTALAATGFLRFFVVADDIDSGLARLQAEDDERSVAA